MTPLLLLVLGAALADDTAQDDTAQDDDTAAREDDDTAAREDDIFGTPSGSDEASREDDIFGSSSAPTATTQAEAALPGEAGLLGEVRSDAEIKALEDEIQDLLREVTE